LSTPTSQLVIVSGPLKFIFTSGIPSVIIGFGNMKGLLIFLSSISLALAGVGVLTPEIEAEALRLWQAYCDGASEGGMDGTTFIYCKKSQEKLEEALKHDLSLETKQETQDQVVFIQPPSYNYKHDIIVAGGGGVGPKTVIYVKPAKNTHEVNIQDNTEGRVAPQKPTLYFLTSTHGGGDAAAAPVAATNQAEAAVDAEGAPAPAAEEGAAGADAPSGGYPDSAARKRRDNIPKNVLSLPKVDSPAVVAQRKPVYILRRTPQLQ
jgi:hypothetical protein